MLFLYVYGSVRFVCRFMLSRFMFLYGKCSLCFLLLSMILRLVVGVWLVILMIGVLVCGSGVLKCLMCIFVCGMLVVFSVVLVVFIIGVGL